FPSSGSSPKFLRAPLPSPIHSLFSGLILDFHQLAKVHAGRTPSRLALLARGDKIEVADEYLLDKLVSLSVEAQ
ncbi:MAG: hypothetical protein KA436_09310, partial [Oligoflexales bacterium]|nr:hypothetical protein [Oligoflexales bacterium]